MSQARRALLILFVAGAVSCSTKDRDQSPSAGLSIKRPEVIESQPKDYPGIHNIVAYHAGFLSGGVPEGDAGFDTLRAMGVRTIISVDGMAPDLARAKARGLRYIHLPIGYDGFDEGRRLELVRATRDAMREGAVYIHCHHGKHRSAGAAAAIAASLGWMTPDESVARMMVSGTAAGYRGLFECARNSTIIASEVIDAIPDDFPSASKPTSLVHGMIELDDAIEHLRAIEAAGWVVPSEHPDLVPAAEAGRLADLHRDLADAAEGEPAEFMSLLRAGHERAQVLEDWLAEHDPGRGSSTDLARLSDQLKLVQASCTECHVRFRD